MPHLPLDFIWRPATPPLLTRLPRRVFLASTFAKMLGSERRIGAVALGFLRTHLCVQSQVEKGAGGAALWSVSQACSSVHDCHLVTAQDAERMLRNVLSWSLS